MFWNNVSTFSAIVKNFKKVLLKFWWFYQLLLLFLFLKWLQVSTLFLSFSLLQPISSKCSLLIPSANIRKPEVFCFQVVWKGNIGKKWVKLFSSQCFTKILYFLCSCSSIETSQLICKTNQMTGFYMTCKNTGSMKPQWNIGLKLILKSFLRASHASGDKIFCTWDLD